MKTKLYISIIALLYTPSLSAQVDLKTGSFVRSEVDIVSSKAPSVLLLQRTYQSRSLYRGLFGFGWCTQYEKRLEFRQRDEIQLYDCNYDNPYRFTLSKKQDSPTRLRYESPGAPNTSLFLTNSQWIWHTTQANYIFSSQGRLLNIQKDQQQFSLIYDSRGKLKSIDSNGKEFVHFSYDKNLPFVTKAESSEGKTLTYIYKDSSLTNTRTSIGIGTNTYSEETTQYKYNSQRNLISVMSNEGLTAIDYNLETDTVSSLSRPSRCTTILSYKRNKMNHLLKTTVSEDCPNSPSYTMQFTYNQNLQLIAIEKANISISLRYKIKGELLEVATTLKSQEKLLQNKRGLQDTLEQTEVAEASLQDLTHQLLSHVSSIRKRFFL